MDAITAISKIVLKAGCLHYVDFFLIYDISAKPSITNTISDRKLVSIRRTVVVLHEKAA